MPVINYIDHLSDVGVDVHPTVKWMNRGMVGPTETPEGSGIWEVAVEIKEGLKLGALDLWIRYERVTASGSGGETRIKINYYVDRGFGYHSLRQRSYSGNFELLEDYIYEEDVGIYHLMVPVPIPEDIKCVKFKVEFDGNPVASDEGKVYIFADIERAR